MINYYHEDHIQYVPYFMDSIEHNDDLHIIIVVFTRHMITFLKTKKVLAVRGSILEIQVADCSYEKDQHHYSRHRNKNRTNDFPQPD